MAEHVEKSIIQKQDRTLTPGEQRDIEQEITRTFLGRVTILVGVTALGVLCAFGVSVFLAAEAPGLVVLGVFAMMGSGGSFATALFMIVWVFDPVFSRNAWIERLTIRVYETREINIRPLVADYEAYCNGCVYKDICNTQTVRDEKKEINSKLTSYGYLGVLSVDAVANEAIVIKGKDKNGKNALGLLHKVVNKSTGQVVALIYKDNEGNLKICKTDGFMNDNGDYNKIDLMKIVYNMKNWNNLNEEATTAIANERYVPQYKYDSEASKIRAFNEKNENPRDLGKQKEIFQENISKKLSEISQESKNFEFSISGGYKTYTNESNIILHFKVSFKLKGRNKESEIGYVYLDKNEDNKFYFLPFLNGNHPSISEGNAFINNKNNEEEINLKRLEKYSMDLIDRKIN